MVETVRSRLILDQITDLDRLQGQEIDVELAEEIENAQKIFLKRALQKGFQVLQQVEEGEDEGSEFSMRLKIIASFFESSRNSVQEDGETLFSFDHFLQYPENIRGIYQLIHRTEEETEEETEKNLTDEEKVFLEFLVGLFIAELQVRIAQRALIRFLVHGDKRECHAFYLPAARALIERIRLPQPGEGVLQGTLCIGEAAQTLNEIVFSLFETPEAAFRAYEFGLNRPELIPDLVPLKNLAKTLCSLRYVEESDEMRSLMTMMQVLHWSAFGGNLQSGVLAEVPEFGAYLGLQENALGWHRADGTAFVDKLAFFKQILATVEGPEAEDIAQQVAEAFSKETVAVLDLGAGTGRKSLKISEKLAERRINTQITATEVSGAQLKALADLKDQGKMKSVKYVDLNRDIDLGSDQYHLTLASLVLHQVMDQREGKEQMIHILREMAQCTKAGGFILWTDVGSGAYLQGQQIPFNLVDREGSVPADVMEEICFRDIAVSSGCPGFVKIPYRLNSSYKRSPASTQEAIYQSNTFRVIQVPEILLEALDNAENWRERDELVREFLNPSIAISFWARKTAKEATQYFA